MYAYTLSVAEKPNLEIRPKGVLSYYHPRVIRCTLHAAAAAATEEGQKKNSPMEVALGKQRKRTAYRSGNVCALKYVDHGYEIDDLSAACAVIESPFTICPADPPRIESLPTTTSRSQHGPEGEEVDDSCPSFNRKELKRPKVRKILL